MKAKHKHLIIFIVLFYLLNIFNTLTVTTEMLNKYITVFPRNILGEMNAFIGNVAALTILLMLGFLFIKRTKSRLIYMLILTMTLNIGVFASVIFTKYYQTVFSIKETTLFKNPAVDLAGSILVEALKDLFVDFKIITFLPFIVLMVYFFVVSKEFKKQDLDFNVKGLLFKTSFFNGLVMAGALVVSFFTLSVFNISMKSNWPIFAERPLYGVQKAGMYNYYLGQALGFNFDDSKIMEVDLKTYKEYNKNSEAYVNIFDEVFSNILYKDDVELDFLLNPTMDKENLNGIFKDKNLVLVHLESLNYFLLNEDGPYLDSSYYSTLKKIMSESYVLENFYTNVGLGQSSDAEFSVLTGAYPLGNSTMYWKYDKTPFVFSDLGTLFSDRYSAAFHGDVGKFYNRQEIYDKMYGFDNYFYFDPKEEYYSGTQNGYWQFPDHVNTNLPNEVWLTENDILEWLKLTYNSKTKDGGDLGFYYPILMQPHTPFLHNPTKEEDLRFTKENLNVSSETIRYLNYESYMENYFKEFIKLTYELKNTVYIFYGDHGSNISQKEYEELFGITTNSDNALYNNLKYQQEMLKTVSFIYVPDDSSSNLEIKPGLLKGSQPRVRSQIDLYRTIIELFGLETNNHYFGVNALSKEHTFTIDTRNFNVITDDYFIIGKRMIKLENYDEAYISFTDKPKIDVLDLYKYVLRFKNKMDHAIRENAYQYLKD